MTRLLPILSLLLIAATPVEAPRPSFGTYLKSPPRHHNRRFQVSDWLVFTPRGWLRSNYYDRATHRLTYNYVFGSVVEYYPPEEDDEMGDML